jgi:hypothetical protein
MVVPINPVTGGAPVRKFQIMVERKAAIGVTHKYIVSNLWNFS